MNPALRAAAPTAPDACTTPPMGPYATASLGQAVRVVFVGRDRIVWRRLVLYVLTLGVSRRVWLYRVNKEIDGHAALGINHKLNAALLVLPVVGPLVVQCQTAGRLNTVFSDSDLTYGPTPALCAAGLVPILGNGFFLGWSQDRLNRYWALEKADPSHAIDIDVGLQDDEEFLRELEQARKESYATGSRFDRRQRQRQERWRQRISGFEGVAEERQRVRERGGSTPVLPWKRPRAPPTRVLHVQCNRGHAFDVEADPYEPVELVCPRCGESETLPPLHGLPPRPGGGGGEARAEAPAETA